MFLYIDPLKQGLKLKHFFNAVEDTEKFLYIDPLKQGLKQMNDKIYQKQTTSFYT